jgi:hypothetical protein
MHSLQEHHEKTTLRNYIRDHVLENNEDVSKSPNPRYFFGNFGGAKGTDYDELIGQYDPMAHFR